MPAILPASKVRAGMRASSTSTTRLPFSSSTPLSTIAPKTLMQNNNTPVMTTTAVSSAGLRPATGPSSALVMGTGASRAATAPGLMSAAAARCRTVTSWIAMVTTAPSCWSARPFHSSLCAPTTSTSTRPWRTARSPAVRLA
jgi:hypothetical protein